MHVHVCTVLFTGSSALANQNVFAVMLSSWWWIMRMLEGGIYSYSIIQEGQSSYKWSHLVGHHMHDFSMWPTALQWRCKCSLTVALVCKSRDFFQGLRTWVGIKPTHSHLRCDALPIELPSPWKQGGGEKGYINASSWCPFSYINFTYGTPLGDSTMLPPMAFSYTL